MIPVLPALVATVTPDKRSQAYWYGLLLGSFGLAQFVSAPLLGAISDRCGRRAFCGCRFFAPELALLILHSSGISPAGQAFSHRFCEGEPFRRLARADESPRDRQPRLVVVLTAFPQFLLQSTWVLFTTFRFGWGPRKNGFSLFIVGIAAALRQTVLLGFLLRKLGDVKTALAGLNPMD